VNKPLIFVARHDQQHQDAGSTYWASSQVLERSDIQIVCNEIIVNDRSRCASKLDVNNFAGVFIPSFQLINGSKTKIDPVAKRLVQDVHLRHRPDGLQVRPRQTFHSMAGRHHRANPLHSN
jgi:hypothetical protein